MRIVNWVLFFLATFICYWDSVKANALLQDTIRDEIYQLYPLGMPLPDTRILIIDYIVMNTG